MHTQFLQQSQFLRLGMLMGMILLLALVGMGSSVIIAETTQGVATAVNQAGSLRMQSFRIATGLASLHLVDQPRYPHRPEELIEEFEQRFHSDRLTAAIPRQPDHQLRRAYERVAAQWNERIGPLVRRQANEPEQTANAPHSGLPAGGYLLAADAFVAAIDDLVRLLEEYAEGKIADLRAIQAVCLLLTVVVVTVSLVLIQRRLMFPLKELAVCAERARRGDFSERSRYVSDDELGRLGQAFNLMAEDLSKTYAELEQRVRDKTEDLAHKNRSLELLYTTSQQVNNIPITEEALVQVVMDVERKLGIGPGTICLGPEGETGAGHRFASTRPAHDEAAEYCWEQGCRACTAQATEIEDHLGPDGARLRMMCFPIRERERQFGVLLIDLADGQILAPWQRQVLETVAGHIGTAIDSHNRAREDRRIALFEERGVIARELHDSLAQSLSYLKIQISRLDACLAGGDNAQRARQILAELRDGTTSAYRQLRELLTTFRLRMDGRGLGQALVETVQEFRNRSTVDIALDNRLPPSLLTPNEEIHVLQIIREALSNVSRHAHAKAATVSLRAHKGLVEVVVQDNGRGISASEPKIRHYGMTIMKERAISLNGAIEVTAMRDGGTRVQLQFRSLTAQSEPELADAI
jgi:two-component system nitrate/nitrite sensor histidine kinase NarX